jgi:hypothetical protein
MKAINNLATLRQALQWINEQFDEHGYLEIEIKRTPKTRTGQQRKAIEVYCRELADAMNKGGLGQRVVLSKMKEGFEIDWTQERVKDVLWREIQKAVIGKESTSDLTTAEVGRVYEYLNRWTGDNLGISMPFPERDEA